MQLRTGFLFFNYILMAMGLICLSLGESFSPPVGTLLFSGLLLCLGLEIKKIIPLYPPFKILSSSWGLLALVPLYYGLDLPLLDLLVWILIFLLFSRLVFKTELNDYLFGYMLALICLLMGAMHTRDLMFAFLFLSFYLVLCWGLIYYNMMAECTGSHSRPEVFKRFEGKESIPGRLFGLSAGLMVLSLVVTTLIFVGFPRWGMGLVPSSSTSPVSGFSEAVRLGDVGRIKKNTSVVMRVEFARNGKPYRPKEPVFWRGVVLDHFNGSSWFSTARTKRKFINQPGVGTRLFPYDPKPSLVRQNIFMDGFDSNVIFTQGVPLFVDGNFRHLQINMNSALKTLDARTRSKTVTLISDVVPSRKKQDLELSDLKSKASRKKFLQLPAMSPEIIRLANNLTQNEGADETRANNILDFLRADFDYTLDLEEEPGHSTLDHFLFTRKKGHCEYFASSMVILLRLAGIPARMVNGFMGVEWNDLGQYMVVRQNHAHSWVEAHFPDKGWVVFDPTPSDPAFAQNQFQDPLSRALDLLRLNWQRYIVRYSMNDQALLFTKIKRAGGRTLESLQRMASLDSNEMGALYSGNLKTALMVLFMGIVCLVLQRPARRWCLFTFSRNLFPTRLYQEMLAKLSALGIHKQPHWTHREFLQRLPALPQDKRDIVEIITQAYETYRFSQTAPPESERKELLNHLRNM